MSSDKRDVISAIEVISGRGEHNFVKVNSRKIEMIQEHTYVHVFQRTWDARGFLSAIEEIYEIMKRQEQDV